MSFKIDEGGTGEIGKDPEVPLKHIRAPRLLLAIFHDDV